MKCAVTTSRDEVPLIAKAQDIALSLKTDYIPRHRRSLEKIRLEQGLDFLMIIESQRLIIKTAEHELFWHPSMAVPRIKALCGGQPDPMVEAMALQPGFRVLDCTLGLAADALVTAHIVGQKGSVIGLEINPFLAILTQYGLAEYKGKNRHLPGAMATMTVINSSHIDYLSQQEPNSFDVVYFDPMFDYALRRSSAMNALRPFAHHEPLSPQTIDLALRVTKKRVVVKQNSQSTLLEKFSPHSKIGGRYSPVVYGVWKK